MQAVPVLKPLALALTLLAAGAAPALAASPQRMDTITVIGVQDSPLDPSIASEQARLDAVPGGTNLIQPQTKSRLATLNDALNYQPGLVVQEFFGGLDQPRLNIRGSGIQSNPVNRGVLLLQDGLPLNEADGSFVIGFLEPRDARLISVRRGANALSPAATTLGGELDFVSLTGTSGDVLRAMGGSFGRIGAQVAKGFETKSLDGRLGVSRDSYNGFRHHSGSDRTSVRGNFGVRGDDFENRTYVAYVDLDITIPTVVPRSTMQRDPQLVLGDGSSPLDAMLNVYKRNPHRSSSQLRIANRSWWRSETFHNTFGVYAQTIDDVFQNPNTATANDGMTKGAQWQLAGSAGALDYRVGLGWARSDSDRDIYTVNPQNGSRLAQIGAFDLRAENRSAAAGVSWHAAPTWTLIGSIKAGQAIRDARNRTTGTPHDQDWSHLSPRVGVIWQPVQAQRFYANLSRSNEAPTWWEIINAGKAPSTLELQKADTIEIGGDGALGTGPNPVHWSLALYRSDVEDELMSVSNQNGTPAGTYNYRGGTRHQGLELGLHGSIAAAGPGADAGFDYQLAWTFSDFRFKGGEYAGNRIAGVPRQLVNAELLYRIGAVRFGPNVRWMPTDTETTHANVPGTRQEAYAVFGFKLDYRHNRDWSAFVQVDNLANKTYASAFVIRNTTGTSSPTFLPGVGRSVSAGFSYRF